MATYAITGPSLETLHKLQAQYPNPNELLAHLKQEPEQRIYQGDFDGMKALYRAEQLWQSATAGYSFYVLDDASGEPECEVYPNGSWLTIMQSPKMTPAAIHSADEQFLRLMNPTDPGNYAHIPAMFRGLETRAIAQIFGSDDVPGIPEGQQVVRPLWLMIDPFVLMRLGAARGLESSDQSIKEKLMRQKPADPADNVVPIGGKKK